MDQLKIKNLRSLVIGILLSIFGLSVECNIYNMEFLNSINWFLPLITGLLALLIIFGKNPLMQMLRPMQKGSIKVVFILLSISFGITLSMLLVFILIHIDINPNASKVVMDGQSTIENMVYDLQAIFTILGEEFSMAALILPIVCILTNKIGNHNAWIIANILGCLFFFVFHLPVFGFSYTSDIVVG
ncbi:hypothetical protein KAR53_08005, partial [Periweissella ghanensis]|nr:hypothetical protein [Periweissella ghanensis]